MKDTRIAIMRSVGMKVNQDDVIGSNRRLVWVVKEGLFEEAAFKLRDSALQIPGVPGKGNN